MSEYVELEPAGVELEMIEFGFNGKVLFKLPKLGQRGVPVGIMSAFGIFYDRMQAGRALSDAEIASAWSFFIQTLADSYPEATRQLARLDEDQLRQVITAWVQRSDYDPKA